MDEPAQENQANDAAGGVVVAAAAGGGNGGGDEAGNVAAANQQNQGNDGNNIEVSANANQNGDEAMDFDTAATAAAAAPSSRYSLRKRKPLLTVQGSNSTSAAAAGGKSNSNSSSAVHSAADPFGYVNTAALTDRQFEKMLAKYEEDGVRERAQKKLRLERGYGDDDYPYVAPPEGCPPFSALPKEAIQLVFELLPSVRSAFNLAFQSKYMLSFVEERVSGAADTVRTVAELRAVDHNIVSPYTYFILPHYLHILLPPRYIFHFHISSFPCPGRYHRPSCRQWRRLIQQERERREEDAASHHERGPQPFHPRPESPPSPTTPLCQAMRAWGQLLGVRSQDATVRYRRGEDRQSSLRSGLMQYLWEGPRP